MTRAEPLRDNPLQTHPAGVLEHDDARMYLGSNTPARKRRNALSIASYMLLPSHSQITDFLDEYFWHERGRVMNRALLSGVCLLSALVVFEVGQG